MCVCICAFVCLNICVHLCERACVYMCKRLRLFVCMYERVCAYAHIFDLRFLVLFFFQLGYVCIGISQKTLSRQSFTPFLALGYIYRWLLRWTFILIASKVGSKSSQ